MKNMKSLIVSLALFVGCVGISHAGGRQNDGWYVTVVTGTHLTISTTRCFLNKVILSSGASGSDASGPYMTAFTTAPNTALNGAGAAFTGGALFCSTTQVIPSLVYKTTATVSGLNDNLSNIWSAGDGPDEFIEVPSLIIRQSVESLGESGKAFVYWSK